VVNFVRMVANSIWSPRTYAEIANVPLGRALRYFYVLALLLTVIRLVPFIVGGLVLLPVVTTGLADVYPPDLEMRVTKGVVTTNMSEPYFIPMPDYVALADGPRNIVVIDTKTPPSLDQLDEFQAAAWVHSDAVYVRGEVAGELVPIPIDEDADLVIDRRTFEAYVADAQPWMLVLGGVGLAGALVALYASFMLRLLYMLAAALLILGMSRFLRFRWSYADSYKAGLFAMTAAFFVDLAVDVAGVVSPIAGFSNMFTLVTVATVTLNLAVARRRERTVASTQVLAG
jgi:hypothetical protein